MVEGQSSSPGRKSRCSVFCGAERMMDRFAIETGGQAVRPRSCDVQETRGVRPVWTPQLGRISDKLARRAPQGLLEELQQQNQELLIHLARAPRCPRRRSPTCYSRELDETNLGCRRSVYSARREHEIALRLLSDLKSRFLFRHDSPASLATQLDQEPDRLLSWHVATAILTPEQEKQVKFFIRQARSRGSRTLVDDLSRSSPRWKPEKPSLCESVKFDVKDAFRRT